MKINLIKPIFLISGLAGFLFLANGHSASAELLQDAPQSADVVEPVELNSDLSILEVETAPSTTSELTSDSSSLEVEAVSLEVETLPAPGTTETSAAGLQLEEFAPQTVESDPAVAPETTAPIAQTVTPGRATRSGPSYVAIGGNIGFGGRTALGRGNFAITSKIGLTNSFSARPGLIVGRSPSILLPVTFDFPIVSAVDNRVNVAPFVGGGLAISTRGGSAVRALAMGGLDVPLGDRFTATASANAAFFRRPEIGVILGVGYNF